MWREGRHVRVNLAGMQVGAVVLYGALEERSQEHQRVGWDSLRGHPFALAIPVSRNCEAGKARPVSIRSASSTSKGITKWSASISLRTRSISIFFCSRTWCRSFMVDSRPRLALCHASDFSHRKELFRRRPPFEEASNCPLSNEA